MCVGPVVRREGGAVRWYVAWRVICLLLVGILAGCAGGASKETTLTTTRVLSGLQSQGIKYSNAEQAQKGADGRETTVFVVGGSGGRSAGAVLVVFPDSTGPTAHAGEYQLSPNAKYLYVHKNVLLGIAETLPATDVETIRRAFQSIT